MQHVRFRAFAALLVGGLLYAAAASAQPAPLLQTDTIPVIKDGRVEQVAPSELEPQAAYIIKVRCLHDGAAVLDTSVAAVAGYSAQIENSTLRAGKISYGSLIVIDPMQGPNPPSLPVYGEDFVSPRQPVPPEVLAAMDEFALCGLRIHAYCAGADWFEAELLRKVQPAPQLDKQPGDLVPTLVLAPEAEFVSCGSISAALSTTDIAAEPLPAAAAAQWLYSLDINCTRGDTLVMSTQVEVGADDSSQISGGDSLILVDPAGGPINQQWPQVSGPPPFHEPRPVPPYMVTGMQEFTLCGFKLRIYLPGADRLEVKVSRAARPAPADPGQPPARVPDDQWTFIGSLSASLDDPSAATENAK